MSVCSMKANRNETAAVCMVVPLTLIIVRTSVYSSSRLGFQEAEENLPLSMMFTLAVRRTVEVLLGDNMVVGGQL